MTLKFYRNNRHEVTLRVTSTNDYHLAWHYRAADGIATIMDYLLLIMRSHGTISMGRLDQLLQYYDDVRIVLDKG